MNAKIFKYVTMAVLFAGIISSCSDKIDNDIDPETTILGKWELVQLTRFQGEQVIAHSPTGYVEYLPDGLMAWYDYTTKKYTMLERKYQLEEVVEDHDGFINKYWILHYLGLWVDLEDGTGYYWYGDYPDDNECQISRLIFFSHNQKGLYQLCTAPIAEDFTYIYKRKN